MDAMEYNARGDVPDTAAKPDTGGAAEYCESAVAFGKSGDYDKALRNFSMALQLDAGYAPAYFYRGFTYFKTGEYAKAIADLSRAIELKPKDAAGYAYRGNAYAKAGDNAKALKDFAKAMEVDPAYSLAYYDLGTMQASTGKREEAVISFQKYLAMQPSADGHMVAWALYSIACLKALAGRKREAFSFLEQALEKGLSEREHIAKDPDLDQLRAAPEFIKLMRKYLP